MRKTKRRALGSLLCIMLLLLSFTACSSQSEEAQQVNVTAAEYTIVSDMTTFSVGKKYHFVITNKGKIAHEVLLIPNAQEAVGDTWMNHEQIPTLVKIDLLKPGETKSMDYTFSDAAKGTKPQLACYYEGHHEAGMFLSLSVK